MTYQWIHSKWLLHAVLSFLQKQGARSSCTVTSSVSKTQSKAKVTLGEHKPRFPGSKFKWRWTLWQRYTTRMPHGTMEVFSRKYKTVGGYGCLRLFFKSGGMRGTNAWWAECRSCHVLVHLESYARLYIKQAYFLQKQKKKNRVVISKNAAATDSSPGARLGLNSLKVASGRCPQQLCASSHHEPWFVESPPLESQQDC